MQADALLEEIDKLEIRAKLLGDEVGDELNVFAASGAKSSIALGRLIRQSRILSQNASDRPSMRHLASDDDDRTSAVQAGRGDGRNIRLGAVDAGPGQTKLASLAEQEGIIDFDRGSRGMGGLEGKRELTAGLCLLRFGDDNGAVVGAPIEMHRHVRVAVRR